MSLFPSTFILCNMIFFLISSESFIEKLIKDDERMNFIASDSAAPSEEKLVVRMTNGAMYIETTGPNYSMYDRDRKIEEYLAACLCDLWLKIV